MRVTFHLRIWGTVQGVGFRHALRAEALRHGASGWVRNRGDGSVEAVVQGNRETVEALIAWARRGPAGATVTELHARPATGELGRDYEGFEVRMGSA